MSEQAAGTSATQAAAFDPAGFSKSVADQIKAGIAEAIQPIVENQKIIADTFIADRAAKADAEKRTDAKPLMAEEMKKFVGEQLAARDTVAKRNEAKNAFIAEKLKGVPAAYHGRLGDDPAKWPGEEQAIRNSLKSDLAMMGVAPKEVSGGDPGGASGSAATAEAKITGYKSAGMSDGEAALAASIVLPGKA
jgi:hypothetical protein